MPSKLHQQNFLMIDHRAGDPMPNMPRLIETATVSCSHCQQQVILRPERIRSRAYCPKCDHYICDRCEVVRVASGYTCRPFKQVIDEYLERTTKASLLGGHNYG